MSRTHRVLVIGDTHTPGMLSGYPDFLMKIHDKYQCNKIVHIGDLVDFHCLSYHERNPDLPSVPDEIERSIAQIALLSEMFPRVELLMGNHDALLERKAITSGISPSLVKRFAQVFDLPRSWKIHPRYTKLIIDDVLYQHGDAGVGGQQAALKNAMREHMSVVQGHFHSQSGVWYYANERSRIFGVQTGCGLDYKALQFAYGIKFSAKPIVSCAVILDGKQAIIEPMELK